MWKQLLLSVLVGGIVIGAALLFVAYFLGNASDVSDPVPPAHPSVTATTSSAARAVGNAKTLEMVSAPGLEDRQYAAPLADALRRIDPAEDGWQTEAFYESVSKHLSDFGQALEKPNAHLSTGEMAYIANDFVTAAWQPSPLDEVFRDPSLIVRRAS